MAGPQRSTAAAFATMTACVAPALNLIGSQTLTMQNSKLLPSKAVMTAAVRQCGMLHACRRHIHMHERCTPGMLKTIPCCSVYVETRQNP